MGVVVKRYIDILTIILYSTCISSFFGSTIPTSLFIFKMLFWSCFCYFAGYIKGFVWLYYCYLGNALYQASELVITYDNCYILLLHKQQETGFLPFGVKGN